MRVPESLASLVERGIIESVVRPLMSGKEAEVYLVLAQGEQYVAKVYKDADRRSFKNRAGYLEGRGGRNTRDRRAMNRRSRHGKAQQEANWRSTEADVIFCLYDAGVTVPEPKAYVDDVLVMELVTDEQGNPAPRLADLRLEKQQAEQTLETLIGEVVKMLCAGWVHSDLSEFNILAGPEGPVIIDFPQAVNCVKNRNASSLLLRDVANLTRFFGRFSPKLRSLRYGEEMWDLYEQGLLTTDTVLTGHFKGPDKDPDTSSLLAEIEQIEREYRARREALGLPPPRPARKPQFQTNQPSQPSQPSKPREPREPREGKKKRTGGRSRNTAQGSSNTKKATHPPQAGPPPANQTADPNKPRRRRRRRRRRKPGSGNGPPSGSS